MSQNTSSQKGLIGAIVFAAVVVSASLGFLGYQMSNPALSSNGGANNSDLLAMLQELPTNELQGLFEELSKQVQAPYDTLVDDDAVMGDENAPVTLIEFSDYQCPYCHRHFTETQPALLQNYVETGKVKYVFRDFPLAFHKDAKRGANAAECAREQGGDEMYFAMNKLIFGNFTGSIPMENLVGYATDLNLDTDAFESCVEAGTYDNEIDADMSAGAQYGINGTPGFILTNGEKAVRITGAQPYAAFEQEIEALLQ